MCSSCENNSATPNKRRSGGNTARSRKKNKTSNNNPTVIFTEQEIKNQNKVDEIVKAITNGTSELHSSIQNGVKTIQASPYYEMKAINPNNPNEEYYLHRYLYNNIILDLVQLKETTPHYILALMLCLTKDSKHSLEGDTTFESREAMDKCTSARLFGLVSDYFEKYFPDNDIDYGNDCNMKAFNARSFFCERQASSSSNCKKWTRDEAEARFFPISILAGICQEWGIPILVLDLCGSGGSCARTQLKNLHKQYKCITYTDGSVHMACAITRYHPNSYKDEEDQCGGVTMQYEKMGAAIKTTHDISVAHMKVDDSFIPPEYKPLSDFLKDSRDAVYVVHNVQEEARKRIEERKRKADEKEAQRVERQRKKDAKAAALEKEASQCAEYQAKKLVMPSISYPDYLKEAQRAERQRKKDAKAAALEVKASRCAGFQKRKTEMPSLSYSDYLAEEKKKRDAMTADELRRENMKKKKEELLKVKKLKEARLALKNRQQDEVAR